jgi:hypothetical protein
MRNARTALLAFLVGAATLLTAVCVAAPADRSPESSVVTAPSPSTALNATPAVSASLPATVTPSASPSPSPAVTLDGVTVHPLPDLHGQWVMRITRSFHYTPDGPFPAYAAIDEIDAVRIGDRSVAQIATFTSGIEESQSQLAFNGFMTDNLLREQFSPDGRELVLSVVVRDTKRPGLVVIDLASGAIRRLARDPAFDDWTPAWSPRGDLIAFTRTGPDYTGAGIWVVDPSGGGAARRVADPAEAGAVTSWTGDGSGIGFMGNGFKVLELATGRVTRVDTSNIHARGAGDWRAERPAFVGAFADAAPFRGADIVPTDNGDQFIELADDELGRSSRQLIVLKQSGAEAQSVRFRQARWRPGGNELLYVQWTFGQGQTIYTTTPSSAPSARAVLTVNAGILATWTPDGGRIVYLQGLDESGVIRSIRPDGSDAQNIDTYSSVPEADTRISQIDLAVVGY